MRVKRQDAVPGVRIEVFGFVILPELSRKIV